MKKLSSKKKIWMAVVTIVLIAVFVLCYFPFVQMKDFVAGKRAEEYISNGLPPDKTEELLKYLEVYPLCWFIHKGDTYSNIPFLYNDTINKYKMDIKFNWDNSVTISDGTNKFDLHVNRIWVEPLLFPFSDYDPLKLHETDDSLFAGIFMYDDKDNEIDIYRQNRKLALGGKRVGFRIKINGKVYVTGAKERFHY